MLQRMLTLDPGHSALVMDPNEGLFYVAPVTIEEQATAQAVMLRALFYVAHDPTGELGAKDAIMRVMREDNYPAEAISVVLSQFASNSDLIDSVMRSFKATPEGEPA